MNARGSGSSGHLFIVNGDLTKIACDAILVPTDGRLHITPSWRRFLQHRTYPRRFESRVMKVERAAKIEPDVWLGNLGRAGNESTFDVFEETVREFVAKACVELGRADHPEQIYRWPKFRLAVNVIGSGYGGARHTKGEVLTGLIDSLTDLAAEHDVDLVLVTYGEKAYAAAQRARRRIVDLDNVDATWRFRTASSDRLAHWAQQIAEAAITSHLVLFIGAGASAGAGCPTWNNLLAQIARLAGFSPQSLELLATKDPRDQATLIERRLEETVGDLRVAVAAELQLTERYSLQHGLLASLPSREAVTTNFDDLFETAVRVADRQLAVLPNDPRDAGGRWLLKLHGSVERPDSIILTRSDYLAMPRQYGALIGLVQGMLLMRHMVFVGYSLQDEDFQELIYEVRAARGDGAIGRRGTVLTLFEDDLERQIWAKDLDVVPMIDDDDSATIPEAARELELFLDLVGFLSTTSAAFFLDSTYSSLSADEAELRAELHRLAALTADAEAGSVAYLVKQFVESLGSEKYGVSLDREAT